MADHSLGLEQSESREVKVETQEHHVPGYETSALASNSPRPRHIRPSVLVLLAVAVVGLGFAAYRAWSLAIRPTHLASGITGSAAVRIDVPQWKTSLLLAEGTHFDFGEVKGGSKLSHTFQVKNVGRSALRLDELKMNCACNAQVEYVALSPSPQPSPQTGEGVCGPGESCGIRVSTTAVGYGQQGKTLPFALSVGGTTETLFKLELAYRTGWIEQAMFVPKELDLGQLFRGEDAIRREVQVVLIAPPDAPEPQVLELTSDTDAITAVVQRQETPDVDATTARVVPAQRSIHWIALEIHPDELPLGPWHQHIVARTSTGTVRLVIRGQISRSIVASPASLLVDKARTGPTSHLIRLRSAGEATVVIQSADCSAGGVTCQIDHERGHVVVRVEPNAELDSETMVEIHAEAGKASETLRVPLVVF